MIASVSDWFEVTDEELKLDTRPRDIRLGRAPALSAVQLDCLIQLGQRIRGDGYVNSKSNRSELVDMGLADRFNGYNFITKSGVALLETLGLLKDSGEVKP